MFSTKNSATNDKKSTKFDKKNATNFCIRWLSKKHCHTRPPAWSKNILRWCDIKLHHIILTTRKYKYQNPGGYFFLFFLCLLGVVVIVLLKLPKYQNNKQKTCWQIRSTFYVFFKNCSFFQIYQISLLFFYSSQ